MKQNINEIEANWFNGESEVEDSSDMERPNLVLAAVCLVLLAASTVVLIGIL